MSDNQSYLDPYFFVDSDNKIVVETAQNIIGNETDPVKRAIKLFYWARDEIKYNPFVHMVNREIFPASAILKAREGFCVQKAIALAALCRAADIPCKVCFADIKSHIVSPELYELMKTNLFVYHGYNLLFLNNKWVKATCAFDLEMCKKSGFIPVEFDGINDATLSAVDIHGNPHIEYLRHIGDYAEFPFDNFVKSLKATYLEGLSKI